MNVSIRLRYIGWESTIERNGSFPVNNWNFKENPDMAVVEAAYQWIRQIQIKENISKIIEVTYNGDRDITDLINKKLYGWNNDLPF